MNWKKLCTQQVGELSCDTITKRKIKNKINIHFAFSERPDPHQLKFVQFFSTKPISNYFTLQRYIALVVVIYKKRARILIRIYERAQKALNWLKRLPTDLELFLDCRIVFIWFSVHILLSSYDLGWSGAVPIQNG